jgi:hypothetical protein
MAAFLNLVPIKDSTSINQNLQEYVFQFYSFDYIDFIMKLFNLKYNSGCTQNNKLYFRFHNFLIKVYYKCNIKEIRFFNGHGWSLLHQWNIPSADFVEYCETLDCYFYFEIENKIF